MPRTPRDEVADRVPGLAGPGTPADAGQALAAAFRDEWGRVVAALIRRTGDWDLAEESAQHAFEQAARKWPLDGVPDRPGAWLTTVAGNAALDRLRRVKRGDELLEQVGRDPTGAAASESESARSRHGYGRVRAAASRSAEEEAMQELLKESEIEDDRLRLIFTCCHPALALEARVALTLRAVAGLTTGEIAKAFLVPEPTMGKRLTRAKGKIAAASIPYRVPAAAQLPERLGGVLAVLYLLFNEGYLASTGGELIRCDLTSEAIRLTRLLAQLMPDEPEVKGLLALMLFNDSRRAARTDADGELVTLEEQDRSRWDRDQINEAVTMLRRVLGLARGVRAGPRTDSSSGSDPSSRTDLFSGPDPSSHTDSFFVDSHIPKWNTRKWKKDIGRIEDARIEAGRTEGGRIEGGRTEGGTVVAGPYVLQAAIAACHATAPTAEQTDWGQIEGLYRLLLMINDTPMIRLNHAIAVALAGDFGAALAALDELEPELEDHYLLHATRADLLRRCGESDPALVAYRRALALAPSEPERRYLTRRVDALAG